MKRAMRELADSTSPIFDDGKIMPSIFDLAKHLFALKHEGGWFG